MSVPRVKFGLFVPAAMHARLKAACGPNGVSDGYARAFSTLLDQLDAGEVVTFPAVRTPKSRASIRLDPALCKRLRARLLALNLKITDFACTAVERAFPAEPGA
jgi:hypothetical protein